MGVTFVFSLERKIFHKDVTEVMLPCPMENPKGYLKQWEISGTKKVYDNEDLGRWISDKGNVFCRIPILRCNNLGYG